LRAIGGSVCGVRKTALVSPASCNANGRTHVFDECLHTLAKRNVANLVPPFLGRTAFGDEYEIFDGDPDRR
jgi:hypothetical protein